MRRCLVHGVIAVLALFPVFASAKDGPNEKISAEPSRVLEEVRQHIDAERFELAVQLLKNVKAETPAAAAKIDLLLGRIFLAIGKPQKASDFFEHAAFSTLDDAEAFLGMAQAKLALGKLTQARQHARTAIQSDADLIKAQLVLAHVDDRSGRVEEARGRFAGLFRNQPGSEPVAVAYGKFLFQRGEEQSAVKMLSRFVSGHPQAAKANDVLGQFLWQLGDKEEALQYRANAAKLYIAKGNDFRAEAIIAWIQARDAQGRYVRQFRGSKAEAPSTGTRSRKPSTPDSRPRVAPAPRLERPEPWPFKPGTRIKTGSGFIVDDGRHIVTNRHVIKETKEIAVRSGTGQLRRARVIRVGEKDDLAVLELSSPFPSDSSIPFGFMSDPNPGRSAVVMGFPLSHLLGEQSPSLTDGIVSKTSGFRDDPTTFQITAKMNKGNSGGPVFDRYGNVIGVAVAKLDVMKVYEKSGHLVEDVNLAIKVSRVGRLMNWGLGNSGPTSGSAKMSLEDLYQAMLPKVVMIAATLR